MLNFNKNIAIIISLFVAMVNANFGEDKFSEEKLRVISNAQKFLNENPITITSFICERSTGGIHDYYSEGDYWWQNPEDPDGPYIRKDGLTNPDNFNKHREMLRRFSIIVPALTAAYKITEDNQYSEMAIKHLRAWFIDEATKMNSNLLFAQAIKGKVNGRGIGIIDTIHLVEIAQSILILNQLGAIDSATFMDLQKWFANYLEWLTKSQFGIEERDNGNNHSTCWAMQCAMFAKLTSNKTILNEMQKFYKEVLLPSQMAEDGSFPKELARTKPYGYSIFNLDAMAMLCEIAGNKENDLWNYTTADGRGMKKAVEFLFPYLMDKEKWPFEKDVMHWNNWPVRQPALLFASIHFNKEEYFDLWKELNPEPKVDEIIRNYPIRQPLLWIE